MLAPVKSSSFRPTWLLDPRSLPSFDIPSSFLFRTMSPRHAFVAYNSCALSRSSSSRSHLDSATNSLSLSLFVEKLAFIFGLFYIYAYGRTTVSGTTRGSGRRTHPWVCEEIKRISAACSLAAAVGSYKRSTGELDELLAREELIDRGPA